MPCYFAIAFGSLLNASAIRRGNANTDSADKLSLASRNKLTCKQTDGD
jgi:hypothetical protein